MTTTTNGSTKAPPRKTDMNLYVFDFLGTFHGYNLADGGTDLIVGGHGTDQVEAMTDAADKLHGMGYRDLVIIPR